MNTKSLTLVLLKTTKTKVYDLMITQKLIIK